MTCDSKKPKYLIDTNQFSVSVPAIDLISTGRKSMARIRYLKPDFFTDEDVGKLPFHVRLFYQGLWVLADKEGRIEDRPQKLKISIFPYDDINAEECLQELTNVKQYSGQPFIHRYTCDGQRYIQIINWHKHQKPHHTEKDSNIPAPPEFPLFENSNENNNIKSNLNLKSNLNQLKASTKLNNRSLTVKDRLNSFSLPPDKQTWDDISFRVGLTQDESDEAYINFGANGWKRGNKIEITSWEQVEYALTYWRNHRNEFKRKEGTNLTTKEQIDKLKKEGRL